MSSFGYGPIVADPPARLWVTPDLLADYISNGTALPLKTVAILDQGNTQVIQGEAQNTSVQKVAMSCYSRCCTHKPASLKVRDVLLSLLCVAVRACAQEQSDSLVRFALTWPYPQPVVI